MSDLREATSVPDRATDLLAGVWRRPWARSILFVVLYSAAVWVGRATRLEGTSVALVWPAAGISFVWLAASWRRRPELLVDIALLVATTVGTNMLTGASATLSVAFGAANGVQAVVACAVFRRLAAHRGWTLRRTRDLTVLLVSAVSGSLASALIAPTALHLLVGVTWSTSASTWVLGNTVSTLVIVAALLRLRSTPWPGVGHAWRWWAALPWLRRTELVVLWASVTGSMLLVVGISGLPLTFAVLPFTVWLGLRVGTTPAAAHSVVVGVLVVTMTLLGHGAFSEADPSSSAVLAQAFIGVVTFLTLALALHRDERDELLQRMERARVAAQQQAALLDTVISTITDGVMVVSGDGEMLVQNPAARSMLGTADPVGGPEGWSDHYGVFWPDGRPTATKDLPLAQALAGGSDADVDLVIRNAANPTGRDVSVSARPLPSAAGRNGAVAVFHDVSAARAATREISAARDLLESVLAAATEQSVVGTDPDGLITVFNSGAERMLGWHEDEMIGQSPATFHDPAEVAARAADLGIDPGFEVFVHSARAGRPETRQWTYLTRDGRRLQVRLAVTAMRARDGDVTGYIGIASDVTEQLRAQRGLADSETRFRLAFATAPVGMSMLGLDPADPGRLTRVNPAMEVLTGTPADDLVGRHLLDLLHPDSRQSGEILLALLVSGDATGGQEELRFLQPQGGTAWGACSASVVAPTDGSQPYLLLLIEDVTARRQAEAALTHQALHDSLTGLPNRTLLHDRLHHALEGSRRSGRGVGVIYVDLDGFKAVNDTGGHLAGDQLLSQVSQRIEDAVRGGDTVGRLGGDEFAVVCPNTDDEERLHLVAGRILASLREPFVVSGHSYTHLTASIGLAVADGDTSAEDVLRHADEAMYAVKRSGKNRAASYGSEIQIRAARSTRLLPQLHAAVDNDELIMHGQPVVDLATGRVVAVETLMRWAHPDRGTLPPAEFLDVVEASPLMIPAGLRALHESCRLAATWGESLGSWAPDVHVNVSGRQLEAGDLAGDVMRALRRYSVPATRLVLELTETHMPLLADSLRKDLTRLRDSGVRIAIDDLGTGYSSLTRLTEVPVDILKIDVRFVAGLGTDASCDAVVRAVLGIGQALGLSVIAEGVETPYQAEMLQRLDCATAQGYLYSAPRPERELAEHLAVENARRSAGAPTVAQDGLGRGTTR